MWFFTGIFILLIFVVYRLIHISITGVKMRNQDLLAEVAELNRQLELSTAKEQKALREADIAYKAKGKLLSLMSHEIQDAHEWRDRHGHPVAGNGT